jgi:toxin ParE1/3/4
MKRASLNRFAQLELEEAIEYYESEKRGLGEEFFFEFEGGVLLLERYPEVAPLVGRGVRRFVLPRFPFSLIYRRLASGRIRILAVAHEKRRPQYWTARR